jgi:iron(III) transport system substrate-binding protein
MIPNDFEFAANNRGRILKEWQSRYDGKSDFFVFQILD